MSCKQLIINPGSTSTKLALYDGAEKVVQQTIEHRPEELQGFADPADLVLDIFVQMDLKGNLGFAEQNAAETVALFGDRYGMSAFRGCQRGLHACNTAT